MGNAVEDPGAKPSVGKKRQGERPASVGNMDASFSGSLSSLINGGHVDALEAEFLVVPTSEGESSSEGLTSTTHHAWWIPNGAF